MWKKTCKKRAISWFFMNKSCSLIEIIQFLYDNELENSTLMQWCIYRIVERGVHYDNKRENFSGPEGEGNITERLCNGDGHSAEHDQRLER